jgi:hypothetical protein
LGYYLESVVPEDQLIATVSEYSHEIGVAIIIAVVAVVAFLVYKGWKK